MTAESPRDYINFAPFFSSLTERQLGVSVPAEVVTAWTNLSLALSTADDMIDGSRDKDSRDTVIKLGLGFLKGELSMISGDEAYVSSMSNLRTNLIEISDQQKHDFFRNLQKLLTVTGEIKTTSNPRALASLTRLEGQITARLFLNLLPTGYEAIPSFRNYLRIATRLGRAANALDTFIDMPDDYENGELLVKPNVRNRLALLTHAAPDSLLVVTSVGPGLVKRLGRGMVLIFQKRPSNVTAPNNS